MSFSPSQRFPSGFFSFHEHTFIIQLFYLLPLDEIQSNEHRCNERIWTCIVLLYKCCYLSYMGRNLKVWSASLGFAPETSTRWETSSSSSSSLRRVRGGEQLIGWWWCHMTRWRCAWANGAGGSEGGSSLTTRRPGTRRRWSSSPTYATTLRSRWHTHNTHNVKSNYNTQNALGSSSCRKLDGNMYDTQLVVRGTCTLSKNFHWRRIMFSLHSEVSSC